MSGINKVIIVGRLGSDPEVRYTSSGAAVARFNVATSDQWTDKSTGEKRERTEWHRIVVWSKLAELCSQYLNKGRQVYIEGNLQTRSWEDKDGNKRYTTEIRAQTVQFLGGGAAAHAGQNAGTGAAYPTSEPGGNSEAPADDHFAGEAATLSDEDIPF